jgi:hypothetical protein
MWMNMIPRLSFFQLVKIFSAGFLGCALLLSVLSLGTVLLFPSFVTDTLDMSIHEFFHDVFYFFGVLGIIVTPLMLAGAWGVLELLRQKV